MKKTLPRLSEYVTKLETSSNSMGECFWLTKEFKNQLVQQLNISHFVPAVMKDGIWVVLTEPVYNGIDEQYYGAEMEEYQAVLDNVVFKSFRFQWHHKKSNQYWISDNKGNKFWNWDFDKKTIEDIIPYNLEITDKIAEKFKL